jgi:hypothetical protein
MNNAAVSKSRSTSRVVRRASSPFYIASKEVGALLFDLLPDRFPFPINFPDTHLGYFLVSHSLDHLDISVCYGPIDLGLVPKLQLLLRTGLLRISRARSQPFSLL